MLHAESVAGAWETFSSQANTDAWSLYSFDDELVAPPLWAGPESDTNPYAYSYFLGGKGVWFFADGLTANSAFVGDYSAQKISGVDVSVNVDPAEIDYIDLAVHADGPQGQGYYYSLIYQPADLGSTAGWHSLSFSFEDTWFSIQNGVTTPFQPNQAFLASISEIGVRVFPVAGVSTESFVGIDDFILVPSVEAPAVSTSLSGGNFVMGFTLNPGVSASIEKLSPAFVWKTVAGQSDLIGSHTFTTPVGAGTRLFRVAAVEKLTAVISP